MTGTVEGLAMLAGPSNRSRIYLDVLERNGLLPEYVLVLADPDVDTPEQRRRRAESSTDGSKLPEDPDLDTDRTVRQRLREADVPYDVLETLDPNASSVVEAVGALDHEFLLFSGPGGVILDGELLNAGPRFLHVHAGTLPEYRGSTTVYYSLLAEGQCGATAFVMNEEIDEGAIVARETYPPPTEPETLDLYYDPWIRAQLLVDVFRTYREEGTLPETPQDASAGETYYIVHPVLKHIALLSIEE